MAEPYHDDRWGERRARRKAWKAYAIYIAAALMAGLAVIVLPFVMGGPTVFGDTGIAPGHAPRVLRVAAGIAFTLALIGVGLWNWRQADELRRNDLRDWWAVIGYTMLAMFPVLHVLGDAIPADRRLFAVYLTGIAVGSVFYVVRRLRR